MRGKLFPRQRRAAIFLFWFEASLLLSGGCRSDSAATVSPQRAAAGLSSTVYTADPHAEAQLLSGFYQVEDYSWRWTAQQFSVVLRAPEGATGEAANLVVQLSIPEVVIQKLRNISLSAAVSGSRLEPETYSRAGKYKYSRPIAASLLTSEEVRIDFQLDKVMPAVGEDVRQLGIVVTSIALEPQ